MKRSQNIYATPAQVQYLRLLMNEAFAKRVTHGYVIKDWSRLLKGDASRMIGSILLDLGRGDGANYGRS